MPNKTAKLRKHENSMKNGLKKVELLTNIRSG